MSQDILIKTSKSSDLVTFLNLQHFDVEALGDDVYRVVRGDELPVFMKVDGSRLYFEVDLGPIAAVRSEDMLYKLLDLNTHILPVSFGINSTQAGDERLVLVESRLASDLNDEELLAVFDALELATDTAEKLLATTLQA